MRIHRIVLRSTAMLAASLALACEPASHSTETDVPRSTLRVEETIRAEDGPMTLSVRRVVAEGWRGRLVVASFAPDAHRARVLPSEAPAPLDAIVTRASPTQPFAAIDGGFYDTNGEPMGLVRAGGEDAHAIGERGGSGVFLVEGGRARIVHRDAYVGSDAVSDALQSIDRLVSGGRSLVRESAGARRAARSAVAIDARGGLHLIVAFDERAIDEEEDARIALGRESARTGPTMGEMAALLMRSPEEGGVGAQEALGLDGGFSTSITVKSTARALRVTAFRGTIGAVLVAAR